jgi:hypothetical protein
LRYRSPSIYITNSIAAVPPPHPPSTAYNAMLIESDKYQATSLRKGRKEALEKDLSDGFTLFAYKYTHPQSITVNDFHEFWAASRLCLIPIVVSLFS